MDPSQLPIVDGNSEGHLRQLQQQYHVANRQCGECTACCTFMVVKELHKPAKVPCTHCSATGCGIYETRPFSCRVWACEWWIGRLGLTEAQRPDKLGLMFSYLDPVVIVNECSPGAALSKAALRVLNRVKAQCRVFFVPADGTGFYMGRRDAREEIELAGFAPEPDSDRRGKPGDGASKLPRKP